MCGRYSLASPAAEIAGELGLREVPAGLQARYNIAPGDVVPVVVNRGERLLRSARWGLVPWWAKDPSIGNRLINARAESAGEKPAFRDSMRERRCLVPADGFYEWRGAKPPKTPMYARLKSGAPFAFAGLWDRWRSSDGEALLTCTILTTAANRLLAPVHDRMPVVLPRRAYDQWLDPKPCRPAELAELLRPYPADQMEVYEVSTLVNKPENDGPECVQRIEE